MSTTLPKMLFQIFTLQNTTHKKENPKYFRIQDFEKGITNFVTI